MPSDSLILIDLTGFQNKIDYQKDKTKGQKRITNQISPTRVHDEELLLGNDDLIVENPQELGTRHSRALNLGNQFTPSLCRGEARPDSLSLGSRFRACWKA